MAVGETAIVIGWHKVKLAQNCFGHMLPAKNFGPKRVKCAIIIYNFFLCSLVGGVLCTVHHVTLLWCTQGKGLVSALWCIKCHVPQEPLKPPKLLVAGARTHH